MPRTQTVLARGLRHGDIADTLLLNFADRRKQQGFVFGGKGTCIQFDFPEPPRLRTDDLLVLDDGTLVEVVADAEPLLELRVTDFAALARLVWVLGNRHLPVQVLTNRIRVLGTAQMEALLAERGLAATPITAPFEPDDADMLAPAHEHAHMDHHHHDPHGNDAAGHHHHHHHHHHDDAAGHRHDGELAGHAGGAAQEHQGRHDHASGAVPGHQKS